MITEEEAFPGARTIIESDALEIRCMCGCGDIQVILMEPETRLVSIQIHQMENDDKTLWDRVRSAWRTLWEGKEERSDVVLLKEHALLLAEYLGEICNDELEDIPYVPRDDEMGNI